MAHDRQDPVQDVAQQTPCAQKPLRHSSLEEQVAGSLKPQRPMVLLHGWPVAQSSFVAQIDLHTPRATSQANGAQMKPCGPHGWSSGRTSELSASMRSDGASPLVGASLRPTSTGASALGASSGASAVARQSGRGASAVDGPVGVVARSRSAVSSRVGVGRSDGAPHRSAAAAAAARVARAARNRRASAAGSGQGDRREGDGGEAGGASAHRPEGTLTRLTGVGAHTRRAVCHRCLAAARRLSNPPLWRPNDPQLSRRYRRRLCPHRMRRFQRARRDGRRRERNDRYGRSWRNDRRGGAGRDDRQRRHGRQRGRRGGAGATGSAGTTGGSGSSGNGGRRHRRWRVRGSGRRSRRRQRWRGQPAAARERRARVAAAARRAVARAAPRAAAERAEPAGVAPAERAAPAGRGGRGGTGGGGGAGVAGRGGTGGGAGGAAAGTGGAAAGTGGASASTYDQTILADGPVAYWAMNKFSGSEPDLTGNNHTGTYHSGTATSATLPNGDQAADFNGVEPVRVGAVERRVLDPDHAQPDLGGVDPARRPAVPQRQRRLRRLDGQVPGLRSDLRVGSAHVHDDQQREPLQPHVGVRLQPAAPGSARPPTGSRPAA